MASWEDALLPGDYFDAGDPDEKSHAWLAPMSRTWEDIEEDEKGELKSTRIDQQRAKKKSFEQQLTKVVEKGMIRYLYVILDNGDAMSLNDLKPSRRQLVLDLMETFIRDYFDQNPISQLGYIVTWRKVAEKVTEVSGNPTQQLEALRATIESKRDGEISLQNALTIAVTSLAQIPSYGSREVLIVMGALSTCDPTDINQTIQSLIKHNVRCSVVSLSAEVYVCKQIANKTGGTYTVATDRDNLRQLLAAHIPPVALPATGKKQQRRWIHMGFPQKHTDNFPSLCGCHSAFHYQGYVCPKCHTRFCELPTDCKVCGLTLVSSPHLARSYHHLFPIPLFTELTPPTDAEAAADGSAATCFACQRDLLALHELRTQCPRCLQIFCADCDEYVHVSLHNCPGCEATLQR